MAPNRVVPMYREASVVMACPTAYPRAAPIRMPMPAETKEMIRFIGFFPSRRIGSRIYLISP